MTLTGWMVYALAIGLLVSAAAWCLDRALGRAGLPARWVWGGALLVSVVLPLAVVPGAGEPHAAPAVAPGELGPLPEATPPATTHRGTGPLAAGADLLRAGGEGVSRVIAWSANLLPDGPGFGRTALALWFGGSLAFGGFLLASGAKLRRRTEGWPRAVVRGCRVRISPETGPAVVGLARPEIVLPRWATALDRGELDLVLAHEAEHVRARDPLLLVLGLAAVVAFPWNPAGWWQLRRLRDAVEVDCDRRVLRGGAPPKRYGALLLRLGGHGWRDLLPAAALGGSPPLLERRLIAMKKTSVRKALPVTLVGAILAMGLVALACEADTPVQSADDPETAGAAAEEVEEVGERLRLQAEEGAATPLYVMDGVILSRGIPEEIDTIEIENIEVVRGDEAVARYGERAAVGVVIITTAEGEPNDRPIPPAPEEITIVPTFDEGGEGAAAPEARAPTRTLEALTVRDGEVLSRDDRGVTTLSGEEIRLAPTPDALYIVDGVIVSESAVDIDALDIESIEVVKGPAAERLYGARASNGVVSITTR